MMRSTTKQICLRGRKYVSPTDSHIIGFGRNSDFAPTTLKVQYSSGGQSIIVDRHSILKLKQQGRHLVRTNPTINAIPSKKNVIYSIVRTESTTASSLARRRQSTAMVAEQHSTSRAAATRGGSASSSSSREPVYEQLNKRLGVILLKPRTLPIPRWISPRHYEFQLSEIFGHSSFILVAISYAVDDFFHLRVLAVAGSTAMLFFTYFHPHGRVLWLPFKWNLLFIALNSYRIGKVLLAEWRGEQLSDDLKRLRQDHFCAVDLKDFANLVSLGKIETYEDGEYVAHQVSTSEKVFFLFLFFYFLRGEDIYQTKLSFLFFHHTALLFSGGA